MVGSRWVAGEFKVLRASHWETPLNLNSGVFMLLLLKCSPCIPGSVRAEEGIHTPQTHSLVLAVRSLSRVWCSVTPWTAARQVSLSFTVSQSLLRLTSIELVMPSNHLILCWAFSFCLQSFPASGSKCWPPVKAIWEISAFIRPLMTLWFYYTVSVWTTVCQPVRLS